MTGEARTPRNTLRIKHTVPCNWCRRGNRWRTARLSRRTCDMLGGSPAKGGQCDRRLSLYVPSSCVQGFTRTNLQTGGRPYEYSGRCVVDPMPGIILNQAQIIAAIGQGITAAMVEHVPSSASARRQSSCWIVHACLICRCAFLLTSCIASQKLSLKLRCS
jgi:hypothetical protein